MELELKHIVGYLPYMPKAEMLDFKIDYVGNKYDKISGINQWSNCGKLWSINTYGGSKPSIDRVKLILRPMSDLTKEININGDKITPIIELAKIGILDFPLGEYVLDNNENSELVHLSDGSIFGFDKEGFYFKECRKPLHVSNQIKLFEKLYEWNFDIHGLIENNLAIDINKYYEIKRIATKTN